MFRLRRKHGADFGRNPSGTGAFKFAEWRSNEAVVVEAPRSDGAPNLQAAVFRPITDANTRTAEMLAGGIDLMVEVPPVSLSKFQNFNSYTVHEQAGPHVWFLILNAKEGPFADVRVRQAANYAINKAIVNDVIEGTAAVAAGPTPPALLGRIMTH